MYLNMSSRYLRALILAALFTAMEVVTVRLLPLVFYLPPGTFEVRVSMQFLWHGLSGALLGPWWALGGAVAADLLGTFLNPTGSGVFFPGYTLSAALGGLFYGFFLYKRPLRFWRCAAAVTAQTLVCGLALGALWSNILYRKGWLSVVFVQTPIRLALIAPYAIALFAVMRAIPKRMRRI